MTGGSVVITGAAPAAVFASSDSGNTNVTAHGGTVSTANNQSTGIASIVEAGTGTAAVDNSNSVTTLGSGSAAVFAATFNGGINVANAGQL